LTKKILVINGHPDPRPERYCHALCDAYVRGALSSGLETRRLNVGSLDFPFLNSAEPDLSGTQTELARAIEAIHWATQFAIVFPLWLDAPPPALRELLERANRPGPKFEPLVEHAVGHLEVAGAGAHGQVRLGGPVEVGSPGRHQAEPAGQVAQVGPGPRGVAPVDGLEAAQSGVGHPPHGAGQFVRQGGASQQTKAHSAHFHLKIRVASQMVLDRMPAMQLINLPALRAAVEPVRYNFSRETKPWEEVFALILSEASDAPPPPSR